MDINFPTLGLLWKTKKMTTRSQQHYREFQYISIFKGERTTIYPKTWFYA